MDTTVKIDARDVNFWYGDFHALKGIRTYEGQPRKRAYRIELPGIPVQARVSVNGKKARTTPNQELNGVIVPIKVMDIHKPIVIKIQ